jgi:hypothetical protein
VAVASALAPGDSCTPTAVDGLPFRRVPNWYSWLPISTRDIADAYRGAVGIGLEHDVGELFRRRQLALDQNGRGDFLRAGLGKSPMLPAETWAFCATMAALTSAGVRLKPISFCGSIQIRIARSAPYSWALPTPSSA